MTSKLQTSTNVRALGKWQGMNWIRQEKRLAIYLRDGLACVYCNHAVEDGAQLSLDHLRCHSNGGGNHETNLVTSCGRCNKSRGTRSVRAFCRAVANYVSNGTTAFKIEKHVRNCAKRSLPLDQAKKLINSRGSVAAVLTGELK